MAEPIRAGVVGWPVAHSRSPLIHRHWLAEAGINGRYDPLAVPPDAFPGFLAALPGSGLAGCNVTIPHKETAFRLVAKRDAAADAVGAVNTLWLEDAELRAGNTDVDGFLAHLDQSVPGWAGSVRRAVTLGAGGAARAVVHALASRGVAALTIVARSPERAEALRPLFPGSSRVAPFETAAEALADADLLVNATSLGMTGKPPLLVDLAALPRAAIVYDLVYAPLETGLLVAARARGHETVDGLGMLLHQAAPAFARWFGLTPEVTPRLRAIVEADLAAAAR